MSSDLLFNFNVDNSTSTVLVEKEFDARLSLVWDAFTKKELLDQWWAPKPLSSKTKYMDFRVGGRRFYAMVSPDGTEIGWQVFEYTSITPKSNFTCLSFFADIEETPLSPAANWDLVFTEKTVSSPARRSDLEGYDPVGGSITKVSISIYFESLEELKKMVEMGFKEGFTMTLNELASLLKIAK